MNENRFKFLLDLSDDELISAKEHLEEELENDRETANSPSISSDHRSELLNSDIPYEEEKLDAINAILSDRGIGRGR